MVKETATVFFSLLLLIILGLKSLGKYTLSNTISVYYIQRVDILEME